MITLLTNLKVTNQENAYNLKDILKKLVKVTPKEEGCIEYSIYQEADNPLSFYILESWNLQENLRRHEKVLKDSGVLEEATKLLDNDLNNIRLEKI